MHRVQLLYIKLFIQLVSKQTRINQSCKQQQDTSNYQKKLGLSKHLVIYNYRHPNLEKFTFRVNYSMKSEPNNLKKNIYIF